MILRLVVSVEHRLVTDGQTDTTTANTRAGKDIWMSPVVCYEREKRQGWPR